MAEKDVAAFKMPLRAWLNKHWGCRKKQIQYYGVCSRVIGIYCETCDEIKLQDKVKYNVSNYCK